jgi:hypothetical protein
VDRFSRPAHSTAPPPHRPGHIVAAHRITVNRPRSGWSGGRQRSGSLRCIDSSWSPLELTAGRGPRVCRPPSPARSGSLSPPHAERARHSRSRLSGTMCGREAIVPRSPRLPLIEVSRGWYIRM